MKHPRLAIRIMAAVHLLLFILLVLSWEPLFQGPLWVGYSVLAMFSSQGCLLGLWAALGGKPTPWRAVAVIIALAAWAWYMVQSTFSPIGISTAILTGQTFLVMGILLLARFLGLRLSKAERGAESRPGRLQFSVGQALLWMTSLAVFMGASHYLKDSFAMHFSKRQICLPASWLAVGLATMWLVFGRPPSANETRTGRIAWVAVRFFTLLLLIIIGTEWIHRANDYLTLWECAYLLGCEAATTAASLVVVRLAGYLLVWYWPFRRSEP